ncbi:MAG: DNA polymerase I, partial [Bacteroidaceae bacterium]|nr:DNA polymerase I [Bacteroidaceae bacterium]
AQMLRKAGIGIKGKIFDTMLAHYVLQPELQHGLFQLAEHYLSMTLMDIAQVFGENWKTNQDCCKVNSAVLSEYFARQLEAVYQLAPLLHRKLEDDNVLPFYTQTEVPLALVLGDMELTGVRINIDSLQETSQLFTARMNEYEAQAHELSGVNFNISSPKQVGEVLFERLQLSDKAKKTKTGQYVTSEEVLETLRQDSPVVDNILKYRAMKKLLGTYVDALPKLINPKTGHIHSSFNQAVTATGRLSSSDPNLQNIPVRGDDGKEIRKAFIPEEGQLFFSADYSQIELRVMAHLSGDEHMIDAFMQGNDVHAATAAKIFHKQLEEVTSDERRKAKTANFGIMYGISAFGLAQRMGVSRTEAKELIEGYFSTYTGIRDFIENTKEQAKNSGFIETIFHRRRYIPDINSHNAVVRGYAERNAVNAPIQGSASDIIKIAMVNIFRRFEEENIKSKMILQVHDELNFSVFADEKAKVEQIVKHEMEHACELKVPLLADCGWGNNWLEAH